MRARRHRDLLCAIGRCPLSLMTTLASRALLCLSNSAALFDHQLLPRQSRPRARSMPAWTTWAGKLGARVDAGRQRLGAYFGTWSRWFFGPDRRVTAAHDQPRR